MPQKKFCLQWDEEDLPSSCVQLVHDFFDLFQQLLMVIRKADDTMPIRANRMDVYVSPWVPLQP